MGFEQEAMMRGDASAQCFLQLVFRALHARMCKRSKPGRIGLASYYGLEHRPSALAQHIGQLGLNLRVGVLKRLVDALNVTGLFPDQLLARAQQITEFLGRTVRNETPPDQAVCQQVRQPGGVAYVSLASRQIFDMSCIRKNEFHVGVGEHVPHRLPVNARCLHPDLRAAMLRKPGGQGQQASNRCRKRLHLSDDFVALGEPDGRDNVFLVNVEPSATLMQYFHGILHLSAAGEGTLFREIYYACSTVEWTDWRQSRVLQGPTVQLTIGLTCTRETPTSVPTAAYLSTGFIR